MHDGVSSGDDSDETYTLDEGIESWLFPLCISTRKAYLERIRNFRKWMRAKYNRDLDRCKKKHIRIYLKHKMETCGQIRAIIVVIKSFFKTATKLKILSKNVAASFDSGKQKPPKIDRTTSPAVVRALFREAQKKNDPSYMILLQLLVYCGLRIGATSTLTCSDIIKIELQKGLTLTTSYKVRVKNGKGGKFRQVAIKSSVGAQIWKYAQSLDTVYLFPSKSRVGKSINSQSLGLRVKSMARKIKEPQISAHFLRHFFASTSCHAGMSISNIQHALGHSSCHTTNSYLHASKANVSAAIDLSEQGEVDVSVIHLKSRVSKQQKILPSVLNKINDTNQI